MVKQTCFLLLTISLLVIQDICAKEQNDISPYGLEDEVKEQLDELRAIVRGAISRGYLEIDSVIRELLIARTNTLLNSQISINEEYEVLNSELNQIKILAVSSGQEVEQCLDTREDLFHSLPQTITSGVDQCIPNRDIQDLQNDSRYRIDTLINEVNILGFQIERCGGEILCLSPLVRQIELAKVEVPQSVDVELVEVRKTGDILYDFITECGERKIVQYVTEGTELLKEIATCLGQNKKQNGIKIF